MHADPPLGLAAVPSSQEHRVNVNLAIEVATVHTVAMRHKNKTLDPTRGGPIGPRSYRTVPSGLPARIVAKRLRHGLSQEALGELLGVARESIARWELGTQPKALYRAHIEAWLRKEGP